MATDGIPTPVDPVQLTTTDAVLYTVPDGKMAIIKHMLVVAGTGSDAQVGIYRRRANSGGDYDLRSKSSDRLLLLADEETWDFDLMLGPAETLRGSSNLATGVWVHISAIEATTTGESSYPLLIAPVNLTTSEATVHTVAAGYVDIIKEILINAGTQGDAQVSIFRRVSSVDYPIRIKSSSYPITNADTEVHHYDLMLDENESLRMSSDTTGVDVHISAVRVTKT